MLSIKPPGWEKIQTNRVMNKLEKELLETQLVRFHQKQLPMKFEDSSVGTNMFLLLQEYLNIRIEEGWGKSQKVNEIRSFVSRSIMDSFLIMVHIEDEVKNNEGLNN